MRIIINGSLAYDRIMVFEGKFGDYIMPDKTHQINLSFAVNGMREKKGGTAGNISYGLSQLAEPCWVWGNLGRDGAAYKEELGQLGINAEAVRLLDDTYTASCYIVTDTADNQITVFNGGAMNFPCRFAWEQAEGRDCIFIVAAGNLDDMAALPGELRQRGIPFIFDPGQSLTAWRGRNLTASIQDARLLICNDYELEVIMNITGLDLPQLRQLVQAVVVTKGEEGSLLLEPQGQTRIPAVPVERVLDPTGAGDAYRSGLLKALAGGLPMREACLWGTVLASYAVSCYGTQEYLVDKADFEKRMAGVRKALN